MAHPPQNNSKIRHPYAHLAATTVLLDLLATERHARLRGRRGAGLIFHPSLDLAGHGQERLLDIRGRLRGRLQELNAESVRKLLPLLRRHDALPLEIALVTHEEFVDVFACIPVNFV